MNQLLAVTELSEGQVAPLINDVADEFGPEFVLETIEECRDQLAGPDGVQETPPEELLDELRERFGVTAPTTEEALSRLEDRLRGAEQEGINVAVNRLSRGFGVRFDSLDDAIERLRERIAQPGVSGFASPPSGPECSLTRSGSPSRTARNSTRSRTSSSAASDG